MSTEYHRYFRSFVGRHCLFPIPMRQGQVRTNLACTIKGKVKN